MADLNEIAESLNVKIADRRPPPNKKNNGQKRRAWLVDETPQAEPVAGEQKAISKPAMEPSIAVEQSIVKPPVVETKTMPAPPVVAKPRIIPTQPVMPGQRLNNKLIVKQHHAAPTLEKIQVRKMESSWQPFVWPKE